MERLQTAWEPPADWFERWWEPTEFFLAVLKHSKPIPSEELMTRPELRKLLEAYVAGLFSMIRSQHQEGLSLRLRRDTFPDFDLRLNTTEFPFEVVEADQPERRRDEEYRQIGRREAQGLPSKIEHFDPDESEHAALPAIGLAIENKAGKRYRPAPHLLVYVNFWLFDVPPLELLKRLVRPWQDLFPEIWLLWGGHIVRCSPDPIRLTIRWVPPGLVV
jgi:hypothetical protein